jgi:hypothetical protein
LDGAFGLLNVSVQSAIMMREARNTRVQLRRAQAARQKREADGAAWGSSTAPIGLMADALVRPRSRAGGVTATADAARAGA